MFEDPLIPHQTKQDKYFKSPTQGNATTGRYMEAGTNYGTGYNVKVGTKKASSYEDGPIPLKVKLGNPNEIMVP